MKGEEEREEAGEGREIRRRKGKYKKGGLVRKWRKIREKEGREVEENGKLGGARASKER